MMENIGQNGKIGIKDCACQYNEGWTPYKFIGTKGNFCQEAIQSLAYGIMKDLQYKTTKSKCVGDQLRLIFSRRQTQNKVHRRLTEGSKTRNKLLATPEPCYQIGGNKTVSRYTIIQERCERISREKIISKYNLSRFSSKFISRTN